MATSSPDPRRRGPDVWPLVGRRDEVELAADTLRRRHAVVLAGAAGVGKTRLAREVLSQAQTDGYVAVWTAATRSASTVPLGAFAHLLPPETITVHEGQDGRATSIAAIVRTIGGEASGGTTVVGVDDAHLLDDASATLVHTLATSGVARVLATVRSGEATPDPVVALWKDDLALRIELQPISRIEVGELLAVTLGGTVDAATARRLFEVTRGNVLFLRELVVGGLSSGTLVERAGVWRWDGPLRPGVALRDLIAHRVGALDDAERDAVELLAIGEPVTATVLSRLFPAEVFQRLERRRLLESSLVGGRIEVRLDHPLFGEVLVDDLSPLRLDDCRRRLAAAWQQEPSLSPDDVLRIANWRDDAGDHDDPALLLAGARRAKVLGDNATAERLARTAEAAAPSGESALVLGDALHLLGRNDEAIVLWEAGRSRPGGPLEHARFAARIADAMAWGLGRPDDARDVLRRAAADLRDSAAQDQLVSFEALLASIDAPTTSQAIDIAERELDREGASTVSKLRAQLAAAASWIDAGKIDRAVETSEHAVGVALGEEEPGLALYHGMVLTQGLVLGGRLPEAESLVDTGHEMALSAHADVGRGAWRFLQGVIALFRGRPHQAAAAQREADLLLGQFDYGLRRGVLIWLGLARALAGDGPGAERALADAQETNRSRARLYDADWARAHAWALVASGQHTKALAAIVEAAEVAVRAERWMYEVIALHDRARFVAAAATVQRLDELTGIVQGRLAPACAAHARALASMDGDGLDAAATTFSEIGFGLFATEAQVTAVEAHRRAGRKASAHASAERARRLTAQCPDASTPLLRGVASIGRLAALTARERETAELAARGLSDREIADSLILSIRTVHAHLRSAYAKLGVTGRGELAEIFEVKDS